MIGYSLSFVSQIPYLFITRFERIYTYMLIGYARVSTHEQNLDLQRDALKNAGCTKTFTDTVSGGTAERPGLAEAFHYLRDGDTLVVWRLDRRGPTLKHLIETITQLHCQGIGFKSPPGSTLFPTTALFRI